MLLINPLELEMNVEPQRGKFIYPHPIATHPQKLTRFAICLTDDGIYVFEPQEVGGNSGT